ncbi:MAG TPA: MHYT domain-containing protein [Longimicrobiaceae bacterium]|nr:MHYT domain-containing protein [Longimicrobiaceae bacterium]
MTGSYDARLVVLSVLIAVLTSYAALALASRVTAARGRFRLAWLVGGSVALGTGLWSMHFVGMLAFALPVPMAYYVPTVVASALVPMAASALALWVISRPRVALWGLAVAGAAMGTAVAGMHYVGMAALRLPARLHYHPPLVAASLAIAVLASLAALWVGIRLRADETPRGRRAKLGAALAMGLAVAGMHYTAMAAARFTPDPRAGYAVGPPSAPGPAGTSLRLREDDVLRTPGLAAGVVLGALTVLAIALLGALVDRRARARYAETEALRRSEDRFRSLVVATAQIIWTTDARGELADEQPEWASFTGTHLDGYRGWGWLQAVHPADRARAEAAWRQALQGRALYQAEFRLRRWDGEFRQMAVRAVPVLEPNGRVREWVGAGSDVTDRRKAEAARDFLAEASKVLASSLDYPTTLATVARLAVPKLADWCAVDLVDEDGRLERVAVEHPDPAKLDLVHELQARYPTDPASPHGVHEVVRTGRSIFVPEIPEELVVAAARDAEHLRIIRELGLRSYMVVPLMARGRTLGAITLVQAESGRRYEAQDLALVEELARRAAVGIDNAVLYRETEEARVQLEQQAAELEEAQAEMEMAHDELQAANEELQQRTAEAECARAAADEANTAKSAFLATMSHELRTPLNAIAGYTQLLEMGIHGPVNEAQREALEKVRRNQEHLLGLINDVLNFAKIEAGQVQYRIEDVPVDAALSAVEALIEPQLRAREQRYTYRPGDPAVTVRADRERMEQVVLNLLTNAVKFTDPGGSVVLEWEADGRTVRIRVRDTGRGIPADKLHAIFEPFVQVDPTLTRSSEGTGLGLAISRDLARAMRGDLTADSAVGVGSAFTLSLPQGEPAAAEEARPDQAA